MAENCPVCKTVLNGKKPTQNSAFSTYAYDCPRCGKFVFRFSESELAMKLNYGHDNDKIFVLSHNIRKRNEYDPEVCLDGILVEKILKETLPKPAEQKNIFIRWVGDNIKAGGDYVRINGDSILSIIGARKATEFDFIFQHLKEKGFIRNKTVVGGGENNTLMDVALTFEGLEYYEKLKREDTDKKQIGHGEEPYGGKDETEQVSLQGIIEVLKNLQKSKKTEKDVNAARLALSPIAKTYDILCRHRGKCGAKTTDVIGWLGSAARDGSEYYQALLSALIDPEVIADIEKWQGKQAVETAGAGGNNRNGENTSMEWDVFICHASEDKEGFVRPLVNSLRSYDLKVWYDEFTLTVGDSLRRSIDKGLANSRYGIVVISPSFFSKDWPQKELDGLAALEVNGRKVILPVWHQIDVIGVRKYSPILADRVATTSQKGIEQVTIDIFEAMKRPLTKNKDVSLIHKSPNEHHLHNFVSASEKKFEKVKNMMPEIITQFKTDLSAEDNKLIREFFVLPNNKVLLGGSEKPRLIYYEEEHKGLRNKIDILENEGFLIDVTSGNAPIYRMTEEFVELIIKYG